MSATKSTKMIIELKKTLDEHGVELGTARSSSNDYKHKWDEGQFFDIKSDLSIVETITIEVVKRHASEIEVVKRHASKIKAVKATTVQEQREHVLSIKRQLADDDYNYYITKLAKPLSIFDPAILDEFELDLEDEVAAKNVGGAENNEAQ
ncbi:hypothetical protein F0562_022183 [Nyssa sinensis]|uniref:Uncharacterized protein n=1 Tax=Nyssa sinensis TaxID=561372 RepID=A0A5J5BSK0_9ASTE|nr:hypothetical protein F0562_022183 [Nyssa sinensis]